MRSSEISRFFRLLTPAAFVGVSAISAPVVAQSTNLFQDGSFESPSVPVGGFSVFTGSSGGIPSWSVLGPEVAIVSGALSGGGFTFQAQSGSQWMDLSGDGNPGPGNGISQSIATQVGMQYDLSFYIGSAWVGSGAILAPTVDVIIGSAPRAQFTNTNLATGGQMNWQVFATTFVADSSVTTIQFFYGNAAGTTNWVVGLDTVSMSASVIPAPGAVLSMAAAGLARRRRRSH